MNIQQLRYVVATVDEGSMTAAAAALFVAQPALSRAVRSLERELGVELFRRAGRGVALTPAGRAFVARARAVLASIEQLRELPTRPDGDTPLVIAASPTLQASLAVPILAALRERGVTVPTRLLGCASSSAVIEAVGAGAADLGICDQVLETSLTSVPLGRAEVRLYSPTNVTLPEPVPLGELARVPLVLPSVGSERRRVLDLFFEAHGVQPPVAVESDERTVWLAAVSHGLGSCVWHSVEALGLPPSRVVARSFDPSLHQELVAVHPPGEGAAGRAPLLDVLRRWSSLADADGAA